MERIRNLEDFGGVLLVQIGGGRSVAVGGDSVIFFLIFFQDNGRRNFVTYNEKGRRNFVTYNGKI